MDRQLSAVLDLMLPGSGRNQLKQWKQWGLSMEPSNSSNSNSSRDINLVEL